MSPEQAEGRLDQVGPLSDVYSLGATLYCLLTGKPPIDETDVGEALRRVQRGEFPPPRAVRPSIPPGLEAICLKAMALKPEDRYPSARALADEIEHWLADEPVLGLSRADLGPADPLGPPAPDAGDQHRRAPGHGRRRPGDRRRVDPPRTAPDRREKSSSRTEPGRDQAPAQDRRGQGARGEPSGRRTCGGRTTSTASNLALREVQDDNVPLAEDLLQGCPVDLRGWEWHYVNRLAHLERLTYWGHRRVPHEPHGSARASNAWPSAPTARGSPPGPGIPSVGPGRPIRPRSGSGIRPPAASGAAWAGCPARSRAWPSAPTARGSPRGAGITSRRLRAG